MSPIITRDGDDILIRVPAANLKDVLFPPAPTPIPDPVPAPTPVSVSADLSASDFTFLGRFRILGIGMTSHGLAYDPTENHWYTIGKSGQDPFYLYRFDLNEASLSPAALSIATNVSQVALLNDGNPLKISGNALLSMKGLLYDNGELRLNFGSYYAAGKNLPYTAIYEIATNKVVGPWMVDPAVHSDRIKGMTLVAPDIVDKATGMPFVEFNYRGSMSQAQSWGLGLAASEDCFSLMPMTNVPAKIVSHWPMKLLPKKDGIADQVQYSDYPGEQEFPAVYLQRRADGSVEKTPIPNNGVLMHGATFVGDDMVVFGSVPYGNQWYGSPDDFKDVPSSIDPSKPTASMNTARGGHVEAIVDTFWLVRGRDIASKFAAGDQKIAHYASGRVSTLGGSVPLVQTRTFGQPVYRPDNKLLYVLNHGAGNSGSPVILVWKVGK